MVKHGSSQVVRIINGRFLKHRQGVLHLPWTNDNACGQSILGFAAMGEARFCNRLVIISRAGATTLLCMNEGLSTRARILLCFDLTEKSHGVVNDVAQDHVMLYFHCRRTLLSK